jgi:tRNA A37 N6-isopentenylltransferase MiaA
MNMYILNKSTMPEYDYEVVGNILNLANNSSDEKFKIQAVELSTQTPVLDYRLAEQFTNLLEQDSNDYIRRLAAQGLMAQYYQAQNKQGGYTKQMAQHLLSVYDNTSDNAVRATLDEMMGNQDMLDELRKNAGY